MQLNKIPARLKKYSNGSIHERGTVVGSSLYGNKRAGYSLLVTFVKDGKEKTYHSVV